MDSFGDHTTNALPKTLQKFDQCCKNIYEQSVGEQTPNNSAKS